MRHRSVGSLAIAAEHHQIRQMVGEGIKADRQLFGVVGHARDKLLDRGDGQQLDIADSCPGAGCQFREQLLLAAIGCNSCLQHTDSIGEPDPPAVVIAEIKICQSW